MRRLHITRRMPGKRIRIAVLVVVALASMSFVIINNQDKAQADAYDTSCANTAAGYTGPSGFSRFPFSVSLFPGQTAITTYRTYVCNATDATIRDWTYTSASSLVVETGRTNVIDFGPTGWSGPSGGFYMQDMGTFAGHEWRKRDVNMGIREAAFDGPGTYTIRVSGKGRIWDSSFGCFYPNPCYGETNTIQINLRITINRPNITCNGIGLDPAQPIPNSSVTVTSRYAAPDGSINSIYQLGAYITAPNGAVTGNADVSYTVESSNALSYTFPSFVDGGGGVYNVRTVLSVPGATWFTPVECNSSFMVAFRPYHKVYGGDVSAGAAFGSPCYDLSAKVIGYNMANYSFFGMSVGSGSQLAVSAMSTIHEFGSGQTRNTTDPATYNIKNLTFANATAGYGGSLTSANVVCAPDYWARANGVLGGNQTIAGRNLANGAKQTIYVDGNAYITGNITYTGEPLTGNYNTIANIPSFRLIVRGNIYIAPGVSELNGTFVAIPTTATNGRVYTCSNGFAPPTLGQMNGVCKTRLTVYGSVVADLIKFNRGGGSVTSAAPGDNYTNGDQAEKFIYTPDAWLTSDFNNDGNLNSIKTLPPIL